MALIELDHIQKTYDLGLSKVPALRDIHFGIERGEFVAIVGQSGSGKSTLMNIIGCLDVPTAGSYRLSGRDVSTLSDDELADVRNLEIGFVFQSFQLLPRASALENVELPLIYRGVSKKERRDRAVSAMRMVGRSSASSTSCTRRATPSCWSRTSPSWRRAARGRCGWWTAW